MMLVADEIVQLVQDFGCEAIGPCPTVAAARAEIQHSAAEAVLLDVNLHGESGCELAQDLLTLGVPFIFMTGYDKSYLPKSFQSFPCIQKPFNRHELQIEMERTFVAHAPDAAHSGR
jgi:DNA-binding response OmpR family regulator